MFNDELFRWGTIRVPFLKVSANAGASAFFLALSVFAFPACAQRDASPVLADRSLIRAFESKDKQAAAQLLDADLIWIGATGHRLTRAEVLEKLPTVANADVEAPPRAYGETAVVRANRVWISSDYGTGGGLVEIKADGKDQEVYFTKDMRNHHATSILIGDHLYGFSGAILTAMRFDTGEVAWRDRSVGKGSLTYADGHLYAFSEKGVVGLIEASPTAYKEKGRFTIQQGPRETWTHPVVAGGRLYLRDQNTIYAFDVREKK